MPYSSAPTPEPRRWLPSAWQGRWVPVRIQISDVFMLLWAATFQAWFRGLDYMTGNEPEGKTPGSLAVVEQVMPIRVWGLVFLAGAVVLAVGMILRRHFTVWAGHSILLVGYSALFLGLLAQSLTRPWADGIRSSTVLLVVTVIHAVFWLRTGPRPLPVPTASSARPSSRSVEGRDLDDVEGGLA